jgi:hypothetical protein
MTREQLELSLHSSTAPHRTASPPRRSRRFAAARWWFARMRDTVQEARTWPGLDPAWGAPGQIDLSLTTPPTRFTRRRSADCPASSWSCR